VANHSPIKHQGGLGDRIVFKSNVLSQPQRRMGFTGGALDPFQERSRGYFELTTSFVHRKKAKGSRNQNIHAAFSNVLQIAVSGLSGNKLILTIFFPPLDWYSPRGIAPPSAVHSSARDCQIRTK